MSTTIDEHFSTYAAFFIGDAEVDRERQPLGDGWRETFRIGERVVGWLDLEPVEDAGRRLFRVSAGAPVDTPDVEEVVGLSRFKRALAERLKRERLNADEERIARLSLHGLDKKLDADSVLLAGKRRQWAAGERVLSEGDPGEHFYVVLSGKALARVVGRRTAVIGEGDVFGEMAILAEDGRRRATVDAAGEFVAFEIPREAIGDQARRRLWAISAERAFDSWIGASPAYEYLNARDRRLWLSRSKTAVLDHGRLQDLPGHLFFLHEGELEMGGLLFRAPMLLPSGRVASRGEARVTILPPVPESTFA